LCSCEAHSRGDVNGGVENGEVGNGGIRIRVQGSIESSNLRFTIF